jgi:hypothetical protein
MSVLPASLEADLVPDGHEALSVQSLAYRASENLKRNQRVGMVPPSRT